MKHQIVNVATESKHDSNNAVNVTSLQQIPEAFVKLAKIKSKEPWQLTQTEIMKAMRCGEKEGMRYKELYKFNKGFRINVPIIEH